MVRVDQCDWCYKHLEERDVIDIHQNIEQIPKVKTFCSENCKLKWIFKEARENGRN